MPSVLRDSSIDTYTPINELELWYDATNTDGNNNLDYLNGDKIDTWKDLSGNGNHVYQSDDSKKPVIALNSNKQYLSFDGYNDSLEANFAGHILDDPSGQNVTIFTVVKPKGGMYILSSGGQTSHARGYALSYQDNGGINSFSTFKDLNGDKEISIVNSFAVNQTNLVTHSYEGSYTNVNVLVNGGTESHVNNTRGSASNGYQSLTIGRPNNTADYYGNFEIAEVIVLSSTDSQKITDIQNYLSNKWGLTDKIDSDGDSTVDSIDPDPKDPSKWIEFPDVLRESSSNKYVPKNGLSLWLDSQNVGGDNNTNLSQGDTIKLWKDLSGNRNHASPKGTNLPILSGDKIVLDGTNYFYVENDDELILKDSNEKKYHIFIVYNSTGEINPSQGSTMLFGNYETNSTIGSYRSGGYPNMYYGLSIYEENNEYANDPGNGFLRFAGRDNEGDSQYVWGGDTVVEADNQFHIISAGESNTENKMLVLLDGRLHTKTRSTWLQTIIMDRVLLLVEDNTELVQLVKFKKLSF